jgi:hypothetical protein
VSAEILARPILIATQAITFGVTTGLVRIKTITAKRAEAMANVRAVTASMECAAQQLVIAAVWLVGRLTPVCPTVRAATSMAAMILITAV